MEYREWGYERDPRDRVPAQSPWSDAGDPADEDLDDPRPRSDRPTSWDGTDRWATGKYPSDTGAYGRHNAGDRYPPADEREPTTDAWTYGRHTGSWDSSDSGWLPQPRQGELDEGPYPSDVRWGQVLDHDDWYEHPPQLPVPRRHGEVVAPSRADESEEDDEDDGNPRRGYLFAILLTCAWYAVPIIMFLIWAATLGSTPEPDCLDSAGNPCLSPKADALGTFADSLPKIATALALSLVLALVIRLTATVWRSVTVGFAAAVVGAGIATVMFSVLGSGTAG